MPSYEHIERYRAELDRLIVFGGSDNEQSIRPAFQNCLDAYCREHRERLMLVPELRAANNVVPDGTVKDSLRMPRGYWEAKDTHDDLETEIQRKFNRGYPRDNIIFEDSQTAVLIQNREEAMRADMTKPGELHRLIRSFLDYELPQPGSIVWEAVPLSNGCSTSTRKRSRVIPPSANVSIPTGSPTTRRRSSTCCSEYVG